MTTGTLEAGLDGSARGRIMASARTVITASASLAVSMALPSSSSGGGKVMSWERNSSPAPARREVSWAKMCMVSHSISLSTGRSERNGESAWMRSAGSGFQILMTTSFLVSGIGGRLVPSRMDQLWPLTFISSTETISQMSPPAFMVMSALASAGVTVRPTR